LIILKVQQLLSKGYEILKEQNIESYIIDCQLILGKVLNLDRMSIIMNRQFEVNDNKAEEYFKLIEKRKNKMPIKYITEEVEFMGIRFFVRQGVLIPRPDTEILVEEVMHVIKEKKFAKICDVCCGSGAIGLSLAKHMNEIEVDCCDISEIAEEVTEKNIELLFLKNNARFIKSDLLAYAMEEELKYDAIVSNPPYIRTEVIPTLMEDVKDYEPYIALWGGDDGLDFYRKITFESLKVLRSGGVLAYEIGYDQSKAVERILIENGYTNIRTIKDLAGNDRVVIGII
jgi:release factor glutamine methyltransferase